MSWTSFWSVLPFSSDWMRWNLFLALLPLGFSFGLFRLARERSLLWWVGVLVFIAFLPNAPYTVTDIIHMVEEIKYTESLLVNTLVILPKYILFLLLGFGAYVLSLINLERYLKTQDLSQWILPAELALHGLSAVGVALGRLNRFNSWDLITQPQQVIFGVIQNLVEGRSLLFIAVSTLLIACLYWITKQIVLGLSLRYQSLSSEASKMGKDQKSASNIGA
ncbi:MAG: DUF1361 domain-containing protein [Leptolyngbyaceae cyanobacterium bins.349]|nr:DUF1361 domain-containing protein [Leptolyngbyaceae cyanobacterium bins.349]